MSGQEEKWKVAFIMAIIIGAFDIIVLSLGTFHIFPIMWSVGSVGVITFLGIMMLANYLSVSPNLDKGEIRKAIAASCFAVYFVLLALLSFTGFSPSDAELAKTIVGHFTYIVGIVAVFYFGSRPVEAYIKLKEKAPENETLTKFEVADAKAESHREETKTEIASFRNEMLTKFEERDNKITSVDANVTSLRNEMISRFDAVDVKEKEEKESFGEFLVNATNTMQKVSEGVEKTVTSTEKTKEALEKMLEKKQKKDDKTSQQG